LNKVTFSTIIARSGSKVFIALPFDPNEAWGDKRRHYFAGQVSGRPVRGALKQQGKGYQISLGPAWRRDFGLDAGDEVEVTLAPEGPQFADLAPDVAAALDAEPEARAFFEALATFYRTGYLKWINGARKPEDRAARIAEMVDLLQAGKKKR
jgi:hypothetical protein